MCSHSYFFGGIVHPNGLVQRENLQESMAFPGFPGQFFPETNPFWLVVWHMAFMTFHSVGNVIIPSDFHSIIFQRVAKNHQPALIPTLW